jgi:hypothetical protein
MLFTRKPFVRSACLLTASAASFILLSSSIAQERGPRLELAAAVGQPAAPPVLNPRHPETYVVQVGDTLWDIASMFLRDPWLWPEIWQVNPQVENPHLIFPGDILSLAYLDDGRPVVHVERGPQQVAGAAGGFERLSPRVRSQPLEDAIVTIPYETVSAFLSRPRVIERDQLDDLPYVVALREGLIGAAGNDVYARYVEGTVGEVYNLVERGEELVDPDNGDVLGYQGIYVGQGRVDRTGDPATVRMLETEREVVVGNYLMPEEDINQLNFLPHAPSSEIDGRIISVLSGVSLIGQYQVVVINRGADAGLEPGHVLRVFQTGRTVRDTQRRGAIGEKVRLPDEPAGTMMVFRTSERISYALVMDATTPMAVLDAVRNP